MFFFLLHIEIERKCGWIIGGGGGGGGKGYVAPLSNYWGGEATNVESTLSVRTFDASLFFFILYGYTAICFRHFYQFQHDTAR